MQFPEGDTRLEPQKRIFEAPQPDDPIVPHIRRPRPHQTVTRRYELLDVSGLDKIPLFPVIHNPRKDRQTDAQWLAQRRDAEAWFRMLSVARFIARWAATGLGYPAGCDRRACRRARFCVTHRDEDDWAFPGPWMPPCASTYGRVDEVRLYMRRRCFDVLEANGGRWPDAHGRDRDAARGPESR